MELLYKSEHLTCVNYDKSDTSVIEVVKIVKGRRLELSVTGNEIVFIIKGHIRYYFNDLTTYDAVMGDIIFRPTGANYSYEGLIDTMIVIFRIQKTISLCENFSIERLYGIDRIEADSVKDRVLQMEEKESTMNHVGILKMNSRVWYFINSVIDCYTDGIKCRCWFDLKIKEFLILLRAYYPKEELRKFFYVILSADTAFSEYVRLNWLKYRSMQKMADSLNMTRKQFTTRFVRVFGKIPREWVTEQRRRIAYREIRVANKPFKQIVDLCGFNTDAELIRFCKKQFGQTPSELRKYRAIRSE